MLQVKKSIFRNAERNRRQLVALGRDVSPSGRMVRPSRACTSAGSSPQSSDDIANTIRENLDGDVNLPYVRKRPVFAQPQPSNEEIGRMRREVEEVSGLQILDDDLDPGEERTLQQYKFFQLRYGFLVKAVHMLIVTGCSSWGPVDMSTGHWISNACCADDKRTYTRIQIANVKGLSCHQLLAGAFFGRKAMQGASADSSILSNNISDKVVSHLCHVKACVNPKHLVIESHSNNIARNKCAARGYCLGVHSGVSCVMFSSVEPDRFQELVMVRRPKQTLNDRLGDPFVAAAREAFKNGSGIPVHFEDEDSVDHELFQLAQELQDPSVLPTERLDPLRDKLCLLIARKKQLRMEIQ